MHYSIVYIHTYIIPIPLAVTPPDLEVSVVGDYVTENNATLSGDCGDRYTENLRRKADLLAQYMNLLMGEGLCDGTDVIILSIDSILTDKGTSVTLTILVFFTYVYKSIVPTIQPAFYCPTNQGIEGSDEKSDLKSASG